MKQSVTHHLTKDGALSTTIEALESYEKKYRDYQPKILWLTKYSAEITFKLKGAQLKGLIEIDDHNIWLDMDIPFLFRPFKSQALNIIRHEITTWLKLAHTPRE